MPPNRVNPRTSPSRAWPRRGPITSRRCRGVVCAAHVSTAIAVEVSRRPRERRRSRLCASDESPVCGRYYICSIKMSASPNPRPGVAPVSSASSSGPGWQARRRASSLARRVDPPDAAPRHLAHGAACLQPAQPALVPRHRGGAPDRRRSVQRPCHPVLGPRQPHPSRGRAPNRRALARAIQGFSIRVARGSTG